MRPFKQKKAEGSMPSGKTDIVYHAATRPEQDKWTYPWPSAVTQYGSHVTNVWYGNQLPGASNFIPGVWQSFGTHMQSRNLQTQSNLPLSTGTNGNIQGMGLTQSNSLLGKATSAWQTGGIWQSGELQYGRK